MLPKNLRLTIDRRHTSFGVVSIRAKIGKREVGHIELRNGFVNGILVDPDMQRRGIATKLYEKASEISCVTFGEPLTSGSVRGQEADSFWRKQVRKRRATCIERSTNLLYRSQRGCVLYQLKKCGKQTLNGVK